MSESAKRARLLFVDDEESIRLTLTAVLQKHGFDVTAVGTVADALVQINCCDYDALLCDLNIEKPGDGFAVIGAMRYSQPQCVSMVLTAYPSFENAMNALRHQVDEFFTKPADVDSLVRSIRKRLDGRRSQLPVPFKTLTGLLREKCGVIVEGAAAAAKSDPLLGRTHLTEEYAGEFARFMDVLIEYVDVGRNGLGPEVLNLGIAYGRRRRKQGCDARVVVREFQVLQERICQLIASTPLGLAPDFVKCMKGLNSLVIAALRPYGKSRHAVSVPRRTSR
ncbi:MAG TPA: response regulator [Candidatus Acidoferrales bacterium]|jgi:DNA-binding NtrC family response regulator|nr:response regulator [Candidatus Acidoferrales bacterium]